MSISTCALREEGDPLSAAIRARPFYFSPRPPRGGRPLAALPHLCTFQHFYPRPPRHALREEGDLSTGRILPPRRQFLSTPSARRATSAKRNINGSTINFYPRPPRGGRLKPTQLMSLQNQISIHALREEGDRLAAWQTCFQQDFYPRPPRGGRPSQSSSVSLVLYFYPRPPRGGRLLCLCEVSCFFVISIHALREEGDRLPQ